LLQVQNLIERCLQLYMTRKDVVNTLQMQAKIEPDFTLLGESTGSLTWGPLCPPALLWAGRGHRRSNHPSHQCSHARVLLQLCVLTAGWGGVYVSQCGKSWRSKTRSFSKLTTHA